MTRFLAHPGLDALAVGLVAAALVALALIEDAGFAAALALIGLVGVALLVPALMIWHEESTLPWHKRGLR